MFIDSHCHLEMESYNKDRDEVIEKSLNEGILYILTVGTEKRYFNTVSDLTARYKNIYGAIGIHPHNSEQFNEDTAKKIKNYIQGNKKIVGYGEIGLDFFKNYSPQDIQINAFIQQIYLARELNMPVIIHSRQARDKTLEILKETSSTDNGGVIHCYSYDRETAKRFLDMGFYISIPGTITYGDKKQSMDVVKYIPLDRLLSETDAPFLTPVPFRGKRNEPSYVRYTVEKIASIKNMGVEEIASCIYNNFFELFLRDQKGDLT
ncbi:MAG TPA: TatD family hydrolase [Syntrophorhabdaceae bacterium]|nr:TatD family hydrolase [Syntrophorhabdaceae bacterium]